jgi:hypothetical protein
MSHKTAAVNIAVCFQSTPCRWVLDPERSCFVADGTLDGERQSEKNAWDVRDTFLSIRRTDKLLAFLNQTGRFTHYANRETWNLGEVVLWQKIIRSISRVKPEGWVGLMEEEFRHVDQSSLVSKFETNFPVSFSKMNKFYVGRITIRTTLQAMIASVYIDWMAGIKMGFCARLDCRKPYEITSSHKRTYCTPECAHHEVVRRSRNRALQKRQLAKKEKL